MFRRRQGEREIVQGFAKSTCQPVFDFLVAEINAEADKPQDLARLRADERDINMEIRSTERADRLPGLAVSTEEHQRVRARARCEAGDAIVQRQPSLSDQPGLFANQKPHRVVSRFEVRDRVLFGIGFRGVPRTRQNLNTAAGKFGCDRARQVDAYLFALLGSPLHPFEPDDLVGKLRGQNHHLMERNPAGLQARTEIRPFRMHRQRKDGAGQRHRREPSGRPHFTVPGKLLVSSSTRRLARSRSAGCGHNSIYLR